MNLHMTFYYPTLLKFINDKYITRQQTTQIVWLAIILHVRHPVSYLCMHDMPSSVYLATFSTIHQTPLEAAAA